MQQIPYPFTRLTALCPGLPRWAGTRKVKPIWILLKQETVSGSGISWAICKSAPRPRQITMPAPHCSVFFYRPDALPDAQPTVSKHWRQIIIITSSYIHSIESCQTQLTQNRHKKEKNIYRTLIDCTVQVFNTGLYKMTSILHPVPNDKKTSVIIGHLAFITLWITNVQLLLNSHMHEASNYKN